MQALENIIIEAKSKAEYALIWLHGLGADGHDFEPIAPQLNLPNVRYVFPHAPIRNVTINAGMAMRAWYDISGLTLEAKEDLAGIQDSQTKIKALIQQQTDSGIAADHIFLVGFSQGGAMALYTGLRYEKPLAGIVALSAYLPFRQYTKEQLNPLQLKTPIFMAHGSADMVVPHMFAEVSKTFLTELGCHVEWHSYAMEHSVCVEEILDLRGFLVSRIRSDFI